MLQSWFSVVADTSSKISFSDLFNPDSVFWQAIVLLGGLLTFLGAIWAVITAIKKNIMKLFAPYREYKKAIDYTVGKSVRKKVAKYYVPTRGQDVDPCFEEEIIENNGKYNTEQLIPFLCKKAFAQESYGKHYLILADSGMGKTTFLVRLYREYTLKFTLRKKLAMKFVPLSENQCMEKIKGIANKEETILLLDALDENNEAIQDLNVFWNRLLNETSGFNKIVITCRTQFFPDRESEPERVDHIRAGTDNKNQKIVKKYLTPFSNAEVKQYLRKRFRFNLFLRYKAAKVIERVPVLMARPLILNWIDCLVDSDKEFEYSFEIYETIIDRWIKREPEHLTKGKLLDLSFEIARYMMEHESTTIPADEVDKLAKESSIDLAPIVAKSRSLLNRNSNDEYKFAHRSFLEYFLATFAVENLYVSEYSGYLTRLNGFNRFFAEEILYLILQNPEDKRKVEELLRVVNKELRKRIGISELLRIDTECKCKLIKTEENLLATITLTNTEWVNRIGFQMYVLYFCYLRGDREDTMDFGVTATTVPYLGELAGKFFDKSIAGLFERYDLEHKILSSRMRPSTRPREKAKH